jgi:ATP-binding cassette, subfamily B, bacterial PglK
VNKTILQLKEVLKERDNNFIYYLIIFSIAISIIETLGVSIIMPFIAVATDFNTIHENQYYKLIFDFFGFEKEVNFVIVFGLLLTIFYIFRGLINLVYFHMLAKFSQGHYYLIANKLFKSYLNMSYQDFTKKNSSVLTKTIIQEATGLTEIISAVLLITSEVFIVIFIYIIMLIIDYQITLMLTLILGVKLLFLTKVISSRLKYIGSEKEKVVRVFYEIINKTFGDFKLIKLNAYDKNLIDLFEKSSLKSTQYTTKFITYLSIPRLFLEALGFGLIALLVTYLVWENETNIMDELPILSMFVLSLYRLIPSINRIMTNYNHICFYSKALEIVYADLMRGGEVLGDEKILFKNEIHLKNIHFWHEKNKPILQGVSIKINKGAKVAFIGESGSGKSTLADIIIGLYNPIKGSIIVDSKTLNNKNINSWREKIGYIPQSVYLFDGTIGKNIAFGNVYDEGRVVQCLKNASMYDFLKARDGVDTIVGERGIMLSGGQKQRIAIARALYLDPEILVLDEATSALDSETEAKIMNEVYNLSSNKTLIIITHRLNTIQSFNYVYELKSGKLKRRK